MVEAGHLAPKVASQALTLPYIRGLLSQMRCTQVLFLFPQRTQTFTKIQTLEQFGLNRVWTAAPVFDWTLMTKTRLYTIQSTRAG